MKGKGKIGLALRIGIFALVALALYLWARGTPGSGPEGTASGLQWQQREPRVTRPTPNVVPRPGPELEETTQLPVTQSRPPVLTEALGPTGAAEYHANGYHGQGARVAVIDAGFDGVQDAIAQGELPEGLVMRRFLVNGRVSRRFRTGAGAHGTACAEIIHDLAPEAQLYLVQVDSFLPTIETVFAMLREEDVDIVSISVAVLAVGQGNGEGDLGVPPVPVYAILDEAFTRDDMLIITSAGNYARQHYRGIFRDIQGDGYHDFERTAQPGVFDPVAEVSASRGERLNVYLGWDADSPSSLGDGVPADYDLLLFGPDGSEVARGAHRQRVGDAPVEQVSTTAHETGIYGIRIYRTAGNGQADALRLWVTGGAFPLRSHQVIEGSLAPPADSDAVISVGAAGVETRRLLSVSSRGPTTDGRIKPDLVSYAYVSVSQPEYGPNSFSGTSAAAPHVAGLAALLLSREPERVDAAALKAQLLNATTDYGTAGADVSWGYGLIQLPPLSVSLAITSPVDVPVTIDRFGHITVEVSVERGDGTPITGLRPSDFAVAFDGERGTVIVVQDLGAGYALHAQRPSAPLQPVTTLDVEVLGEASAQIQGVQVSGEAGTGSVPAPVIDLRIPRQPYQAGDLVPITVAIYDTTPVTGAHVTISINGPGLSSDTLTLLDDGMSGDGIAGDGVYGGWYPQTQTPGRYGFEVEAMGQSSGVDFTLGAATAINVQPSQFDSDGDGMPDNWETLVGLNPQSNDLFRDDDGDGLSNLEEYQNGTHPQDWDTDGDGLSDGSELTAYLPTSPYNVDTDLDGTDDAVEMAQGTHPRDPADGGHKRYDLALPPRPRN